MHARNSLALVVALSLVWPTHASAAQLAGMAAAADLLEKAPEKQRGAVAATLGELLGQLTLEQMAQQFPDIDALANVADRLLTQERANKGGKRWVMSESDRNNKVEAIARRPKGSLNQGPLKEIEARKRLGDDRTLQAIYKVVSGPQETKLALHRMAIAVEGTSHGHWSYALSVDQTKTTLLAKQKGRAVYFRHDLRSADKIRRSGKPKEIRITPLSGPASTWVHQRPETWRK